MDPRELERYFAHEEHIVAHREKELAVHKECLARQATILTKVLGTLGVKRIWLFRSLIRGKVRCDSDLYMAVEGLPYAQDQLLGLAEKTLQTKIDLDLIPWEMANPMLRDRIISEARLVYERETGTSQ